MPSVGTVLHQEFRQGLGDSMASVRRVEVRRGESKFIDPRASRVMVSTDVLKIESSKDVSDVPTRRDQFRKLDVVQRTPDDTRSRARSLLPFSSLHSAIMAREAGLEPATCRVKAGRSASCATPEQRNDRRLGRACLPQPANTAGNGRMRTSAHAAPSRELGGSGWI